MLNKLSKLFNKPINKVTETYNIDQVCSKINDQILSLRTNYNFLEVKDATSFKHYIDGESYHFTVDVSVNLNEKYLSERFQSKMLKFPIGFDIDISTATKQYVDFILNEVFGKCIIYCDNIKIDYESYSKSSTDTTKPTKITSSGVV
jgi:hypothetical protein